MDLATTSKCTEHDVSVQQWVGAGGGCAPSRAEREAKGNLR